MPTYVKRPLDVVAPSYRGNDYDIQRLEEVAQERCGLCWDLYPASMMIPNDGTRRCPDCFADPDAVAPTDRDGSFDEMALSLGYLQRWAAKH